MVKTAVFKEKWLQKHQAKNKIFKTIKRIINNPTSKWVCVKSKTNSNQLTPKSKNKTPSSNPKPLNNSEKMIWEKLRWWWNKNSSNLTLKIEIVMTFIRLLVLIITNRLVWAVLTKSWCQRRWVMIKLLCKIQFNTEVHSKMKN